METGSCPHCGASIRSTGKMAVVSGVGVLIAVVSLVSNLWFFGVIGGALAVVSGYLIYDQRRRTAAAAEETTEFGLSEEIE